MKVGKTNTVIYITLKNHIYNMLQHGINIAHLITEIVMVSTKGLKMPASSIIFWSSGAIASAGCLINVAS